MSTLNNNLLLDFGKIENNNIFLVLNSDIYDSIELNDYLTLIILLKFIFHLCIDKIFLIKRL